ncbi:caspase family protein [Rhizobium sp. L1K21]|uniref:caspase family protein n=1 Tax=Rhizobium sp. L1K21 TaxID=2954933 RepID=UPI002093D3BB|nr:caspase family protein [Rhizobium sp. L1K21]MCO6186287.1 caspase family protein [Rhizobium sp. L1K21]
MNAPFHRRMAAVGLLALTIFCLPAWAFASARIALVVGMSKYENVNPLVNAASDAEAVGRTLETLGFEVTFSLDQKLRDLVKTVNQFSFRAETADIALVYYAGHGVEIAGQNYLIPTDIQLTRASEIGSRAITVTNLLEAVNNARRLRVVILDSCRNNPFLNLPENDIEKISRLDDVELRQGGLAPPSPQQGTLVVYAAKAGEIAFDGKGGHSPFAAALIDQLPANGTEIGMMFRRVRDEVMLETGNQQEPHFYGSLSSIPYFLAGGDDQIAAITDRRQAWGSLAPAQEMQLASLANQGDARALMGLGYMSLNPDSAKFDPDKAFRFFSSAAEKGDSEAMFELGKLYEKGIGTERDFAKALGLFRKSADLGFADAINDLGFLYFQGAEGLKRDAGKAIQLFLQAADLRHPQAMYNTAALIDDGLVPGKTPEDAAQYLYDSLRSGVSDVLDQLSRRPEQFKPATRKALQALLKANGFYAGAIDGAFGKGTQRSMSLAFGNQPV